MKTAVRPELGTVQSSRPAQQMQSREKARFGRFTSAKSPLEKFNTEKESIFMEICGKYKYLEKV